MLPAGVRRRVAGGRIHERLWNLADVNDRQRYAAYQRLTERPIPIVVLDPA
jgi:F420H(2)-dependent quinone reductase